MNDVKKKGKQGFASLTPEKRKELARKGGLEAHRIGAAHQWTPEEARQAGLKGGKWSPKINKVVNE